MRYSRPFEMTEKGYEEAVKFLKSIGKLKELEHELSTDGYTTVALANHHRELLLHLELSKTRKGAY